MAYRDTWATCQQCGQEFIFKIEDQRQQAERGAEIAPPELCPTCRGTAHPRVERRPRPRNAPQPRPQTKRETTPSEALDPGPHEGTVKWYDSEKRYGFIIHPGGAELFFHRSGIVPGEIPDFPDGTQVTYLVEQTDKGPQAVDVARMNTPE
ncbi:MAG: cold shock domain-containing protein [Chloroflexota bacterium]|nr:cold shock domain-containing protein [Chloroflexota bacterium]